MGVNKLTSVLIVDDNFVMRRKIQNIITKLGLKIAGEAKNGIKALEKCKQTNPDLITLDIFMPEMDGLQTLNELKDNYPDIPIVMITSLSKKDEVLQAIKLGADHYIIKPVTKEKVKKVLIEILGKEELAESNEGD
jgi:two-component system chemotaxis response regulator CheY